MPNNSLRADAQVVAKVMTVTPANVAEDNTFTLACNGKELTYTALAGDDVAEVVAGLAALLDATDIPEFREVSAEDQSDYLELAATAGIDVEITASAAGGTATLVLAETTAPQGPAFWDEPTNWTQGRIPAGACAAPVQENTALAAGGSLTADVQVYYVITALNANGETVKSNEKSATPTGGNLSVVLDWNDVDGATGGYRIYRSTVSGSYTDKRIATVAAGTSTYTDTGAATGAGTPPGASTAIGDDVYLDVAGVRLAHGIAQSAIKLASLNVASAFTAGAGNPRQNVNGYYEYRDVYLAVKADEVTFDSPVSDLFNLDLSTGASVVNVRSTGGAGLNLRGTGITELVIQQGTVRVAPEAGAASTVPSILIGSAGNPASDVTLVLGAGVTLTTIVANGGAVTVQSNVTTLTQQEGTVTLLGSVNVTTLTSEKGTIVNRSDGTITTMNLGSDAVYDDTGDPRPKTITNLTMRKGASFLNPYGRTTVTNGILLDGCDLSEVTIVLPPGQTIEWS